MKWLITALLLTSCYTHEPIDSHMQTMPIHNAGIRAGCIRALARFSVEYRLYSSALTVDEIARRCDEVDRSFYEEMKRQEWQRT